MYTKAAAGDAIPIFVFVGIVIIVFVIILLRKRVPILGKPKSKKVVHVRLEFLSNIAHHIRQPLILSKAKRLLRDIKISIEKQQIDTAQQQYVYLQDVYNKLEKSYKAKISDDALAVYKKISA